MIPRIATKNFICTRIRGLVSPKIPPKNQLGWEAFDSAVEVVTNNGGKAKKGNAQSVPN